MNKKGFTLIEMLVVIAIIAVLVAIIIPTVSSATEKAGAAANAANLRSVYAEVQTDILSIGDGDDDKGYVTWSDGTPSLANAPVAAKAGTTEKNDPMQIKADGDNFIVYYTSETNTIDYFAGIAEDGKAGS